MMGMERWLVRALLATLTVSLVTIGFLLWAYTSGHSSSLVSSIALVFGLMANNSILMYCIVQRKRHAEASREL